MSSAMDELLERFKGEAHERIARIELLAVGADAAGIEQIREEAHKIKGASGMLGFPELKERAADLEDLASAAAEDGSAGTDGLIAAVAALRAALPA